MSWSRKLSRPLHTIEGTTLKTLADARAYAVALPAHYGSRQHWQHAAKLMLEAVGGGGVGAPSKQIYKALFLDMRLDVKLTPA
jgi:hypothetical protein